MKTILVPTDFSDNAKTALNYSVELAKESGARIVLLNCYDMPNAGANVMIDLTDVLGKDSERDLKKSIGELSEKDRADVEVIPQSHYGLLEDGVSALSKSYKIDLIVMGTSGAGNLANKIFGSNTVNLIKKISLPVLVIPEDAEWSGWKNVNVAYDPDNNLNEKLFGQVVDLVFPLKPKFDVLHIFKEGKEHYSREELEANVKSSIGDAHYELHIVESKTITDGILNFIKYTPCDVLVMVRKNHTFLEKLMHASVTNQLALHSNKPLLLFKDI